MVKGLTSDVSDDLIKLTFMNKRKSNGGTVTSIQRKPGSSSAVVYFANWQGSYCTGICNHLFATVFVAK